MQKKLLAIVMTLTLVMMMAPQASALTADELAAQIAALQAQLVALQAQLGQASPSPAVSGSFDTNLYFGLKNAKVTALQEFLIGKGYLAAGLNTSYFGPLTRAAVSAYQAAKSITPTAGYFGPLTRAAANADSGVAPSPSPSPSPSTSPVPAAGVAVSLASNTPVSTTIAGGSSDVVFAKISFTAAEDTVISSIAIKRTGLANNADITEIKLWEGVVRVGSIQSLNSTTNKATFSGLNWSVPANTTKTLTVTATMQTITGGATAGNSPVLGIAAATDIVATKTVSGTFPVAGNAMTLAGISVGYLDVDARAIPANSSPLSGSVDQEMASWTFTATTEAFTVNSLRFTQIGSASNTDATNFKVKVLGAQVGSTMASLAADSSVTFDLSAAPIVINAGAAKVVSLYSDVTSGITTSRTLQFELGQTSDVVAYGNNSGGAVVVTKTAGTHSTYTTQQSVAQTISQSSGMTVALNASTNPSAKAFVSGTTNQLVSAFRFSAGSEENLRVARLKLSLGGTGAAATDISNVTLYNYNEATAVETLIDSSTNFVGTVATWGADSTGLDTGIFDVPKSGHVVVHVRADIPTSASYTTLGIFVNEAKIDGVVSQGNLATALVTITAVDTLGEVTNHSANATVGTIVMATSPSTPAAANVVPGQTDHKFLAVDFTASGEDAILSSVVANLYQSNIATKTAAASGDFVNVKLWDGATQLGSTISSPTTTATFSINLVLTKDAVKTLSVTADVPSTAAGTLWTDDIGSMAIDTDIYATGVYSGAVVADPASDADGTNQTALAETLVVSFLAPTSTTYMINAANAELAKVVLTAGTAGNVRVSSILFTAGYETGELVSDGTLTWNTATDTYVGSLKLYDGATQVGTVLSAFTDSGTVTTGQFSGLSVTVPKGTQKVLVLKGNVLVGGSAGLDVGIADLTGTTDVVGTGLVSNTTIYGTGTDAANSGAITLASAGTLTVAVSPDTPNAANVAIGASGATGVVFDKIKFTSVNEAINLEAVQVSLQTDGTNHVPDIAAIHLYNGATEVGSPGYLTGTSASANVTHTFYLSGVQIPKDDSLTLTLKADLNGTSQGGTSVHTPRFYVADVAGAADLSASHLKAKGASSGATVTSAAGTPNPETATNFNEMTLVKTKPTFALVGPTSTGTLVAATMRVLDFTVTADAAGDVAFGSGDSITFTVLGNQSDDDSTTDTITVRRVDNGASVGTASGTDTLSVNDTVAVTMTDTIAAGTSRTYYVESSLNDFETDGDTFALKINSTSGHVVWDDGTTAGASVNNALTGGLPVQGGYFVNPS